MTVRKNVATIAAGVAFVLATVLTGCSSAEGGTPAIAASCIPMTMEASPSPVVAGQSLTLEFEYVHATCDDVDPTEGGQPSSGAVSLVAADGSWRADGIAQFEVQPDSSASVAFIVPDDAPTSTMSVMLFDREIGEIEVAAP